jgi:putative FmdB family regulatory protein
VTSNPSAPSAGSETPGKWAWGWALDRDSARKIDGLGGVTLSPLARNSSVSAATDVMSGTVSADLAHPQLLLGICWSPRSAPPAPHRAGDAVASPPRVASRAMAIYEYRCWPCERTFELSRPMAEADLPAQCPLGHRSTKRLLSVFASTGTAGVSASPTMAGGGCCGGACGCG